MVCEIGKLEQRKSASSREREQFERKPAVVDVIHGESGRWAWAQHCTLDRRGRMQRLPASPTPSLSSGEAEPEFERVDRAAQASTSSPTSTSIRPFPKFKWPWKRKRVLPELEEESEGGRISVDIAERCDLFAKEVCVSGWKIVGGKSFGDVARVGAYVGELVLEVRLMAAYDVEIALRSVRVDRVLLIIGSYDHH